MNRLMDYLPDIYHSVVDFVELTETESLELVSVDQAIQLLLDNQFVDTASEQSIRRRERILGIQADPTIETLDFRRKRLINRYSTKPPFTIRYLQRQLDFLVGAGLTIVSVDVEKFILTVTANINDAAVFKEAERTVSVVKPANLVYQQQTSLQGTIELKESIKKRVLDRRTRLGTLWHVGVTPFAIAGQEETIK